MADRYEPRSWWEPERPLTETAKTVFVDDEAVATGLLDANGTPLYRVKEKIPFGFVNGRD